MKQRSMLVVLGLVLAITLAACGNNGGSGSGGSSSGSSGSGSPADAAKGFYDGLYGSGQIDQYVCSSNKAAVDSIKQSVESSKSALAASKASIDVSGLKYETANQSGDSADVKVSGKIKTTVAGTSQETDFPPITLKMKNESGWKVCGFGA